MKHLFLLLFSAALLIATGCSKEQSHTATTADGHKVTLSGKGDQTSMEIKSKSGETISLKASASGMELPADFPKDIPLYPKRVVQSVNQMGKDRMIGIQATGTVAEVVAFYGTELKNQGWEFAPATPMGEGAMIIANKGPRTAMFMIAKTDDKRTFIQLSLRTTEN